jgi:Tol biopolymer transport system component
MLTSSPDGHRVVFVGVSPSGRREAILYELDLETHRVVPLTVGLSKVGPPAWLPDGERIAFAAARDDAADGAAAVYLKDLKSGDVRSALDFHKSVISTVEPSWSPDGKFLAVADFPFIPDILTIDTVTLAAKRVPLPSGVRAESVAWSPTSPMLALRSESGCAGMYCGDVYTLHPDGSALKKVSNTMPFHCRCYRSPRWSPDGSKIVVTAYRSYGDMDFNPFHRNIPDNVYVIDVGRSREFNLSNDESTEYDNPTWCGQAGVPTPVQ